MKWSAWFGALSVLSCVGVGMTGATFIVTGDWSQAFMACFWTGCAILNGHLAKTYAKAGL